MIQLRSPITRAKRQTSEKPYLGATVRLGDELKRLQLSPGPHEVRELMERDEGLVMALASIIGGDVAGVRFRVYQPAGRGRAGSKRASVKRVASRGRRKWLESGRAGVKAATFADDSMEVEELFDHPLNDLLDRPNPWMAWREWVQLTVIYRKLTGRAFWHLVQEGGSGLPVSLWQMAPQWTEPVPDREKFISGYLYGREPTRTVTFKPEEVIYLRHSPNPSDPYGARGPLHAVFQDADLIAKSLLSETHRWDNEGLPPYFVQMDPETTETATDLRERILRQTRGMFNKGLPLVGKLFDVKPLGWAPKDMEYQKGRRISEEAILGAFGFPHSLWWNNESNLTSAEKGQSQYERRVVLTEAVALAEIITEFICPLYGEDLWVAPDNPVQEDAEKQAATAVALVNAGMLITDEWRAENGYDPLPDGLGEKPRFNGVPLDQVGETPDFGVSFGERLSLPPGQSEAEETPGLAEAEGQQEIETAEDLVLNGAQITAATAIVTAVAAGDMPRGAGIGQLEVLFNLTTEQAERIMGDAGTGVETTPNPKPISEREQAEMDARAEATRNPPGAGDGAQKPPPSAGKAHRPHKHEPWSKWIWGGPLVRTKDDDDDLATRRIRIPEQELDAALRRWFREAIPAAVSHIEASGAFVGSLRDDPDLIQRFLDEVDGPLARAMESGLTLGVSEVPADLSADALTEGARAILEREKVTLADEVMNSVEDRIRGELAEGLRQGDSVADLQQRVADTVGRDADYASERIARTETRRAFMGGREEAWGQSGVVAGKRWVLSFDPCPLCQAVAREHGTAAVGEPFVPLGGTVGGHTVKFRPIMGGDAHPNDRCFTEPILEGES